MSGSYRPNRVGSYMLVDFMDPGSDTPTEIYGTGGATPATGPGAALRTYLSSTAQAEDSARFNGFWDVDMTIADKARLGLAVALRGESTFGEGVQYIYQVQGSLIFECINDVNAVPFVGRTASTSLTADDANTVPVPILVPDYYSTGVGDHAYAGVNCTFISTGSNWTAYPVVAGFQIVNGSGAQDTIRALQVSLSVQRYSVERPIFDPNG